ncbi:NAD(P)/FAD-dependent oxidoreductase [Kitasatospora sp. NPDC098663]|uniref:NAD(P)/FAD-dependent oxidoreductase n=1 Tax=Kitasatospora sp. NPDC098663 TaxID=3364096 RepID=UPI003806A2BE
MVFPVQERSAGAAARPHGGEHGGTVAVIGAGVAGLTAAYRLHRGGRAVELFEADARLGGHAHTQQAIGADGRTLALDTGFLVHNERTYPHLVTLLRELGVATRESDMSMSVRCDGCGLEYAGARGAAGLIARPGSLGRGRYLRMLGEVPRFHRRARALLADPGAGDPTLREFLAAGGFSTYFTSHFMTPLVAAVWSCAPDVAGDYPARYLFTFLANHGLLSITGSPRWRTVVGGSRTYVAKIAEQLGTVHRGAPVRTVIRHSDRVAVTTEDGHTSEVDAVVIATHADQTLNLLGDATPAEQQVLGAFRYSRNPTVLHRDASHLPAAPRARASWNYRMDHCADGAAAVRVSYHLNRLLGLQVAEDYLVTLNEDPNRPVADEHVVSRTVYEHPVYTRESVAAQARLPELTTGRTAFAGAYHGWGFHEDGCRSGLTAAHALLGVNAP